MELLDYQLIRGFLPEPVWRNLRAYAEETYARSDADAAAGTLHPDFAHSRTWGGLVFPHVMGHFGRPPAILDVVTTIQSAFGDLSLLEGHSTFRRHQGAMTHAGWHNDADAVGIDFDPCFNVWVPLASVGWGAKPSLEIVVDSDAKMRAMPDRLRENWPDDWVRKTFADHEIVCPKLAPGDVLVFSHYTLHRTQPLADQSEPRISAEFRFAPSSQRVTA